MLVGKAPVEPGGSNVVNVYGVAACAHAGSRPHTSTTVCSRRPPSEGAGAARRTPAYKHKWDQKLRRLVDNEKRVVVSLRYLHPTSPRTTAQLSRGRLFWSKNVASQPPASAGVKRVKPQICSDRPNAAHAPPIGSPVKAPFIAWARSVPPSPGRIGLTVYPRSQSLPKDEYARSRRDRVGRLRRSAQPARRRSTRVFRHRGSLCQPIVDGTVDTTRKMGTAH